MQTQLALTYMVKSIDSGLNVIATETDDLQKALALCAMRRHDGLHTEIQVSVTDK